MSRELVSESHQHVFGVVEQVLVGTDVGHELRESVQVLVLGLLCRARVDARRRTPGSRTTTSPGDSFGSGSYWICSPWATVGSDLGSLGHDTALGVSSGFAETSA
jgi:hypothetical protein